MPSEQKSKKLEELLKFLAKKSFAFLKNLLYTFAAPNLGPSKLLKILPRHPRGFKFKAI